MRIKIVSLIVLVISTLAANSGLAADTDFKISYVKGYNGGAAQVSDGNNYLVAWNNTVFEKGVIRHRIYAALVSKAAKISKSVFIAEGLIGRNSNSIAFGKDHYLIVWQTPDYPASIYGTLVNLKGEIADEFLIAKSSAHYAQPVVSFNGQSFMVAWQFESCDSGQILATQVSVAGEVAEQVSLTRSGGEYRCPSSPTIASNGQDWFVVWEINTAAFGNRILRGTRIGYDGKILDPRGINVSSDGRFSRKNPIVSFGLENYVVIWDDDRNLIGSERSDIYATRVVSSGEVLDSIGIPIAVRPEIQNHPRIGFDGQYFFAAWTDIQRVGRTEIYGAYISEDGSVDDYFSLGLVDAYIQGIAFNKESGLIIWGDLEGGIYGRLIKTSQ